MKSVALPIANIDTDQIIPAKFLITTDKTGLGRALFANWRGPAFPLDQVDGAEVLVAGDNFGCGSSREHAPWALVGAGFRAVISTSFADIFRNNALKNGLLPVVVDAAFHAEALRATEIEVDLASQTVSTGAAVARFPIDAFSKRCLLEGVDELGYLMAKSDQITAFEAACARSAPAGRCD